jgi:hypothetical protein
MFVEQRLAMQELALNIDYLLGHGDTTHRAAGTCMQPPGWRHAFKGFLCQPTMEQVS